VDALPGGYQGVNNATNSPCEVVITKKYSHVEFKISDSESQLSFGSISNRRLKRQYVKDFEFRKEQDKHFSPETESPWLIYYVNHGIPSYFGIYSQTEQLEIRWDKEKLYSLARGCLLISNSILNIFLQNSSILCG
jgi:hypothetical protein